MKYFSRSFFLLLLLVIFLKETIFSFSVPIWHGPDEQAHFGQIANIAEQNTATGSANLNREIYETEVLFGTLRDVSGNNKFTFHPEYRIPYASGVIGPNEIYIATFSAEYRKELVINEATGYPPLFYFISSLFYNLVYSSNFINRVYVTRLFGILLGIGMAVVTYLIAKEIFREKYKQLAVVLMVSFQPMISFLFATINSDNLMNLLFSIGILIGIRTIKFGTTLTILLSMVLIFLLGILTKPQFILILPCWIGAILLGLLINSQIKRRKIIFFGLLAAIIGISILAVTLQLTGIIYSDTLSYFMPSDQNNYSLLSHLKMTIYRTYRETIPWYWGVFDWLGVTLPRLVNRILNYTLVLTGLGLIMWTGQIIRKKNWRDQMPIFYLLFVAVVYFFGIVFFDYVYMVKMGGISIGVQGRYFFPTITSHMVLIIVGLSALISEKLSRYCSLFVKGTALSFILLNFIGLYTILVSYYDLNSWGNFFDQISQYKPGIFKYPFNALFMLIYLLCLGFLILRYLKMPNEKNS